MSVTYAATLRARQETVLYLAGLLHAERIRRGTRTATRCLGCFKQAILVLRWFLDNTRLAQLAADNAIGKSTAYDYCMRVSTSWPPSDLICTPRYRRPDRLGTAISTSTAR
jgi:hypothetical protein